MSEKQSNTNARVRRHTVAVWVVNAGLLLIAAGTLLPILRIGQVYSSWIYAAGAILALTGRCLTFGRYKDHAMRVRRLARMEFWSAVVFCVGAFFLFYRQAGPTDWLAFTLAGAALQCYSSIMLPRALAAEAGSEKNGR